MDKKLVLYAAALFGVVTPIYTKLGNVALGIFSVLMLIYILKNGKRPPLKWTSIGAFIFGTTIFIILLLVVGLLYTDYMSRGVKLIGNYFSYLLIPLFFFGN